MIQKVVKTNWPPHVHIFLSNIKEVRRLLAIHKQIAGGGVGYKHNVEVLNKSCIVLLVACFEAYIEDLASSAFEFMLSHADDAHIFPIHVLTQASKKLKADEDERKVWQLAGNGWKKVITDHKEGLLKKHIGLFNTPKVEPIDRLFKDLLGVPQLSNAWKWKAMSVGNSRSKLNDLIELRGAIAHRVSVDRSVTKLYVTESIDFINRVCVICHNAINDFVFTRTGKKPWGSYVFGKTG